jgi:hypothetical protein
VIISKTNPSTPNFELRNYDIGIPILPYCGGTNPSTVLKHEHNMFITAWIRMPSAGTTYLCHQGANIDYVSNDFLETCKSTKLLTSYNNGAPESDLNPSDKGPSSNPTQIYGRNQYREWEKYIIRI